MQITHFVRNNSGGTASRSSAVVVGQQRRQQRHLVVEAYPTLVRDQRRWLDGQQLGRL